MWLNKWVFWIHKVYCTFELEYTKNSERNKIDLFLKILHKTKTDIKNYVLLRYFHQVYL